MVMYGQYENYSWGWFIHLQKSLYALSEIFIREVSKWLLISFPDVMKTLDKNFENEGLLGGDDHFGNTSFSLLIVIVVLMTMIPTMDMNLWYGFFLMGSLRWKNNQISGSQNTRYGVHQQREQHFF